MDAKTRWSHAPTGSVLIYERYAKPLIRKWLTCGDARQWSSSALASMIQTSDL
jgi:hypothetical protein